MKEEEKRIREEEKDRISRIERDNYNANYWGFHDAIISISRETEEKLKKLYKKYGKEYISLQNHVLSNGQDVPMWYNMGYETNNPEKLNDNIKKRGRNNSNNNNTYKRQKKGGKKKMRKTAKRNTQTK